MNLTELLDSGQLLWPAGGVLGLALLLAGAFHRGRSALGALVLLWVWAGMQAGDPGGPLAAWVGGLRVEALVLTAPVALLLLGMMVETALISSRGLVIMAVLGCGTGLGMLLPAELWDGVWRDERLLAEYAFWPTGYPAPGLSVLVALAATLLFGARWVFEHNPVYVGLGVAALCSGGISYGLLFGIRPHALLLVGGVALLVSAGYTSYRMAFLDPLTGLPGRRLLDERLARLKRRYAVAMVDVDHFKKFNDTYGHEVGDQVLKLVAARLKKHFGADAYRYGGEEFSVLFEGGRVQQAQLACDAFRSDIESQQMILRDADRPQKKPKTAAKTAAKSEAKPESKRGAKSARAAKGAKAGSVGITLSIGLAHHGEESSATAVVKVADDALYKAKKAGRNRVVEVGTA